LIRSHLLIVHDTGDGQVCSSLLTDDIAKLIGGKRVGEEVNAFLRALQHRDQGGENAVVG
jgi:hypothetical protein